MTHRPLAIVAAFIAVAGLLLTGCGDDAPEGVNGAAGGKTSDAYSDDGASAVQAAPNLLKISIDGKTFDVKSDRMKVQGLLTEGRIHAPISVPLVVEGDEASDVRLTVNITVNAIEPGTYPILRNQVNLGRDGTSAAYVAIFSTQDRAFPKYEPVEAALVLTEVEGAPNDRGQFRATHLAGTVKGVFRNSENAGVPIEVEFRWTK